MQGKLKIITIGDYKDSILEKPFKDNEIIEFLELPLNRDIKDLNTNFSKKDIVFLRTNEENLEKLLEVGKSFKEKEIVAIKWNWFWTISCEKWVEKIIPKICNK